MPDILKESQYREGADPRLIDIITKAAGLSGYQVEFKSGYRPADTRQHSKKNALDITLIDPQTGKRLPNYQNTTNFRAYEQFAQTARQIQRAEYPDLDNAFRWGGYFSGDKKKYGSMDLMHFDLAGNEIGMAGGSWAKGLTKGQRALWPGVESVGFDDHPVPKGYVPQVATLTDTARPAPIPASLPPQMAFTRQMTLPTYDVTPVLDRRSKKSIENRKEVSVNSGINLPLQNALMPPQPQLRPTAAPYKTAGKVQLNDDRFASGMADKNVSGTTQVASLAPMPPIPRPRPVTSVPKLVADQVLPRGTFRTADLVVQPNPIIPPINNGAGPNIAEKQARALPRPVTKTAMVPNPAYVPPKTAAPGAGLTEAQMRAIRGDFSPAPPSVPQYIPKTITVPGPVAPIPMPRSMRPADPGLNGNPSFQFGTPGLPAGLPAQVPPTRALPPMPRPRPMMPPMVTVSGAAPRAMPPMPLPRPMGMPVQQFQAQGLSPQQAYAAANQAAQERAIANSRDPERNAARAALAARWGFD